MSHRALNQEQFFHTTEADLKPGDYLHPNYKPAGEGFSEIFSREGLGHHDFVHMTRGTESARISHNMFGKQTYEVEPEGLTNRYDWMKTHRPSSRGSHPDHWVSLAPVRVKRRVDPEELG